MELETIENIIRSFLYQVPHQIFIEFSTFKTFLIFQNKPIHKNFKNGVFKHLNPKFVNELWKYFSLSLGFKVCRLRNQSKYFILHELINDSFRDLCTLYRYRILSFFCRAITGSIKNLIGLISKYGISSISLSDRAYRVSNQKRSQIWRLYLS